MFRKDLLNSSSRHKLSTFCVEAAVYSEPPICYKTWHHIQNNSKIQNIALFFARKPAEGNNPFPLLPLSEANLIKVVFTEETKKENKTKKRRWEINKQENKR
jgi:hypothetical protein